MTKEARISLVARVAKGAAMAADGKAAADGPSILSLAAASYGLRPSNDETVPTGFDPVAVALFEALVEGAYLVATADGVFDERERAVFERVVVEACGGVVARERIAALVSDLGDQLGEDGIDRRIQAVAEVVGKREHAQEVLRIAALLAQASDDVSSPEIKVLDRLAQSCGLPPSDVALALNDVRSILQGT